MATVEIRNVRKAFGSVEVLHGVSVDMADGEFVVLVGPSGCGKSTLLRMLAGLENITSGEIAIGGKVVNAVPPKDRDIAMVFQNYALYPHMTVAANMGFSLRLRGAPKAEIDARVRQAAEILGLEPYLERFPRQLSGGQRQRLALARTLFVDAPVAILDDPTSAVDAHTENRIAERMRELRQGRTTIVFTNSPLILDKSDHVVLLMNGKVAEQGRHSQLLLTSENYRRLVVRGS